MLARLELFGHFEFDHQKSGIDSTGIYDTCVIPFLEDAKADPDGFLTDLFAVIADTAGTPPTGPRLVWELYSGECLRIPAALPLIDRSSTSTVGMPAAMLTAGLAGRAERRAG